LENCEKLFILWKLKTFNILFFLYFRYKNGQEVKTDARLTIKRDSQRLEVYCLSLTVVRGPDSGDYEIKATNQFGTASSKSRVVVQSKYPDDRRRKLSSVRVSSFLVGGEKRHLYSRRDATIFVLLVQKIMFNDDFFF
jgi:hypothetical protein